VVTKVQAVGVPATSFTIGYQYAAGRPTGMTLPSD
jgi:hypothetical protein